MNALCDLQENKTSIQEIMIHLLKLKHWQKRSNLFSATSKKLGRNMPKRILNIIKSSNSYKDAKKNSKSSLLCRDLSSSKKYHKGQIRLNSYDKNYNRLRCRKTWWNWTLRMRSNRPKTISRKKFRACQPALWQHKKFCDLLPLRLSFQTMRYNCWGPS